MKQEHLRKAEQIVRDADAVTFTFGDDTVEVQAIGIGLEVTTRYGHRNVLMGERGQVQTLAELMAYESDHEGYSVAGMVRNAVDAGFRAEAGLQ